MKHGLAVLFCLMCHASRAQHPFDSANDTLPDGRKESINPFLGRVGVYNEFLGASYILPTINFEFYPIKRELWGLNLTVGAAKFPKQAQYDETRYIFPIRLQAEFGRRRSRFTMGGGVTWYVDFERFNDRWPPSDNCPGYCPDDPRYIPFLTVGYRYQMETGFFFGINFFGFFKNDFMRQMYIDELTIYPWGGLQMGYRLPSSEHYRVWKDKASNKRIHRSMEADLPPDERKKRTETAPPIIVDEAEMKKWAAMQAKREKRMIRMSALEQRGHGRSMFYAEGFGATGYVSVNYEYTLPFKNSKVFSAHGRVGVGGPTLRQEVVTIPIAIGIRAMRNYRGGGISFGVVPCFGNGISSGYFFIQPEIHIMTLYGITFGVSYQLILDPNQAFERGDRFPSYGGFMLGYRLANKRVRTQKVKAGK